MDGQTSGNVDVRQRDSHTSTVHPPCAGCTGPDNSLTAPALILTKFCRPAQPLIGHRELPGGGVGEYPDLLGL